MCVRSWPLGRLAARARYTTNAINNDLPKSPCSQLRHAHLVFIPMCIRPNSALPGDQPTQPLVLRPGTCRCGSTHNVHVRLGFPSRIPVFITRRIYSGLPDIMPSLDSTSCPSWNLQKGVWVTFLLSLHNGEPSACHFSDNCTRMIHGRIVVDIFSRALQGLIFLCFPRSSPFNDVHGF